MEKRISMLPHKPHATNYFKVACCRRPERFAGALYGLAIILVANGVRATHTRSVGSRTHCPTETQQATS